MLLVLIYFCYANATQVSSTVQVPYYCFLQHNITVGNTMELNGISNRSVCRVIKPEKKNQLNNRGKKSKSMLIPVISCYVTEYQIGMCEEYCTSRHFTPTESVWSKHYWSDKVNCVKFCTWFFECGNTNQYIINE